MHSQLCRVACLFLVACLYLVEHRLFLDIKQIYILDLEGENTSWLYRAIKILIVCDTLGVSLLFLSHHLYQVSTKKVFFRLEGGGVSPSYDPPLGNYEKKQIMVYNFFIQSS